MSQFLKKGILFCLVVLTVHACIYKAGNRKQDLSYHIKSSINSYYVERYMFENYRIKDSSSYPINAELYNYPNNFFLIIDHVGNYGYVIENNVMPDSTIFQSVGLRLSSVYDYQRKSWIYERDSLESGILTLFEQVFENLILKKTVAAYQGKVPDSLLFNTNDKRIEVEGLY